MFKTCPTLLADLSRKMLQKIIFNENFSPGSTWFRTYSMKSNPSTYNLFNQILISKRCHSIEKARFWTYKPYLVNYSVKILIPKNS